MEKKTKTGKISRKIIVPTGEICIINGCFGSLEMLSLGDYGKDVNIKADFLGLGRTPSAVRHTKLLPLEKKWVITISTQYGCSMGCTFCDVPKVGPGKNATLEDLLEQVDVATKQLHPEITSTERLNIHFARMGEPTWNPNVITAARLFKRMTNYNVHPVVSTMMPRYNKWIHTFLCGWMHIKNEVYAGNAGLQLSVNSTDEGERREMFRDNAMELSHISEVMKGIRPKGRKITLNFAVAGYTIDPEVLLKFFDPAYYLVKLTPMHKTSTALGNNIYTAGDYTDYVPYQEYEMRLREAGYDVIVFIASREEDLGRITCGNAILSGSMPDKSIPYTEA